MPVKFRVWDGEKMILDPTSKYWFGELLYSLSLPEGEQCEYKGWVLMQYSDQMDKDGKTVAVGDIVDFEYGLGIVFWSKATSCFKIAFDTDDDDLWFYCPSVDNCLEIIGNIYDNKDLIPAWHDKGD